MRARYLFLALCFVGLMLPNAAFWPWLATHGLAPRQFVADLFANGVSAFFGLDVVLSALVLVLLLIFILQNLVPVRIAFLGWDGALPTGISLLFAAVAGALVVAVPGSLRIRQLRRQGRRQTPTDREPVSARDEGVSGGRGQGGPFSRCRRP